MGQSKKILVVDDDRVILKFISNLLAREGNEVHTAQDGFEAINLLTSFTPDIMFFDLIMPKIDGDKLIQIMNNMPHLKDCYLVIVSAAVAELDQFNFAETGADYYIAKGPFSSMAENILAALEASDQPRDRKQPKPVIGLEHIQGRQLTKELLSKNRHLETILESMAEGILEVLEGKIVYANSAAINIFGLPQEKLLAAYPPELFPNRVRSRIDPFFTSQPVPHAEIGENSPVELRDRMLTIKKLPVKGDSSTVVLMITDITDRKKLELQLQHVQKMEAIGTIASGVAHNFRNTLTEILVNSQVIQMNAKDQPDLAEITQRISTSVKRGARLVDGLLQFSRKEIKKEFKVLNLVDLIRETHDIIHKSFDRKIEIKVEHPEYLPIMGDESGLSQVLMNLCTNARDAMPEGGRLTIRAERSGNRAVMIVSDTGQGMDQDTIEKCFDPFFTTKPIGKGTGLGLSTTYGIVKSHEGQISVISRPQQGTTLKLQFPLASGTDAAGAGALSAISYGRGQRVLVVDDEPEILHALHDLLKILNYRPELAPGCKEALALYPDFKPEVVLMDINMPQVDGLECAQKIIDLHPEAKIGILSGYEPFPSGVPKKNRQEIIKGHLTKPVDISIWKPKPRAY